MKMRVLISGGGTGGHIFPAIAIADAMKKKNPECEILFVGAEGKMEMEKIPAAGYKIVGLPVRGFQRKFTFENLKVIWNLCVSMIKAWTLVGEFKPDAIIGVGGYASGPVMRVGGWRNVPIFIQEQNSFPGVTNKILAASARKIFVAYEGMEIFFAKEKLLNLGNPVRKDLLNNISKSEALSHFQLSAEKKTIAVLGGSLGARALNEMLALITDEILNDDSIQLIWQCGKIYEDQIKNSPLQKCDRVKIYTFISRMDMVYAASDLVICRAGALTLAELAVSAKPSILIPSPNVAEDHQRKNAQAFVNQNAAVMILEKDIDKSIWDRIKALLKNEQELKRIEGNLKRLAKKNAADDIAEAVIEEVNKKN